MVTHRKKKKPKEEEEEEKEEEELMNTGTDLIQLEVIDLSLNTNDRLY